MPGSTGKRCRTPVQRDEHPLVANRESNQIGIGYLLVSVQICREWPEQFGQTESVHKR